MKYLITGGAGFIGSNLVRELLKTDDVVVVDNLNDYYDPVIKLKNIEEFKKNNNFKFYKIDILDDLSSIFESENIDFIIHLAGQAGVRDSITDPFKYVNNNCIGTLNILEMAKKYNIKNIIMASSSSVYGNNLEYPFNENMKCDEPISIYAASKKSTELMAYTYHHLYNINIFMLRFFTVYGPGQRPDLAISKFVRLMLEGKEIPMYGDGNTKRDYTYIDDIISAIKLSSDYILNNNNVYEILNIGSNNPISLKEMIDIIANVLGVDVKINKLPMQEGDVLLTYADISKARKLIGYEPSITFNDGITKFVEWYKNE